jgi:hypothetical protein
MTLEFAPGPVPLKFDADGNVRVSGTRVTLDTIIGFYEQGFGAEELAEDFRRFPSPTFTPP